MNSFYHSCADGALPGSGPRLGRAALSSARSKAPRVVPGIREPVRRLVAAMAGVILITLSAVGPATAQAPLDCATPVVDTSGTADLAAVDAAWSRIDRSRIGPEATVLVRVWDTVPGADLAAAVDEVVALCAGDPVLGIAADAVVLGLSVRDGRSDVLVGGAWTAVVPDADVLRTAVMGPSLAQGDITGGLIAALDFLASGAAELPIVVEPTPDEAEGADEAAPQDAPAAADGGTESEDEAGAVIASESVPEPEPRPGDGGLPFAVALGALGVGACGGVVFLVSRHRALGRERERLRRKVEPALGRLRLVRERHQQLTEEAKVWYVTGAGRTRTEVGAGIRRAETAGKATDQAAGLLYRAIPDGVDDADRAQAAAAHERVAELLRSLEANGEALDELAAIGAHLDHLEVALPVKAELLAHELPEVRKTADQRASDGFAVDSVRARLTDIQTAVGEVKDAEGRLEVDLLELSDRLEAAEATLFSVDHELQQLPLRAESLKRWHRQLVDAADHELTRTDALRRQLAMAAVTSAADSWRWAAEHPDSAVEALERADAHGEQAIEELIPAQHFEEAGRSLDAAGLELIAADELLDQLDDLLVDLESARAEAPGLLERVDHSLEVLAATINRYRDDLPPTFDQRQVELTRVAAGLRTELRRPKPNFIRIVETGEVTDRAIDELLVEADKQHQRTEALRRELDRQRNRASRALARARRSLGWQLFPSADGAALDRLESQLASPPTGLAAAVDAAADIADAALRLQEQIIARRRRRGAAASVGSGPPVLGGGWSMGGSARRSSTRSRSQPGSRSSGGRSFGGRRPSSGGRSLGSGRSTGRF